MELSPPAPAKYGRAVRVVARPEDLELIHEEHGAGELIGVVRAHVFRGARIGYRVELANGEEIEVEGERRGGSAGGRVAVRPRPKARIHVDPEAP